MTDQPDRAEDGVDRPHHGDHEPRPGTVPAADLLADLRPAPLAIAAHGLGLRTGHGWVFRDLDLAIAPGSVTAIVAPAGSGRSALLLALTGRMRITDGTLVIAGRSAMADPRAVRDHTAVARIAALIVPEDRLTVDESVTERCLIDGVAPARGRAAFRRACATMSRSFDGTVLVEHLSAVDRAVLALALAAIRPAAVIVLDDTDSGVTADGEREIYRAALELATLETTVVTTTTRREVLPPGVTAVQIAPPAEVAKSDPVAESGPAAGEGPVTTEGPAPAEPAPPGDSVTATEPITATTEDET